MYFEQKNLKTIFVVSQCFNNFAHILLPCKYSPTGINWSRIFQNSNIILRNPFLLFPHLLSFFYQRSLTIDVNKVAIITAGYHLQIFNTRKCCDDIQTIPSLILNSFLEGPLSLQNISWQKSQCPLAPLAFALQLCINTNCCKSPEDKKF